MKKEFTGIIGIIIALLVQTVGIVWWAASLNSKLEEATQDIATSKLEIVELRQQVQSSAAIILTREQLNDILGVRDERLDNIERTLHKMDAKLDNLSK